MTRKVFLVTFNVPGYRVTAKVQAPNAEQAKVKAFILSGIPILSVKRLKEK